jgi:hypothetical protein
LSLIYSGKQKDKGRKVPKMKDENKAQRRKSKALPLSLIQIDRSNIRLLPCMINTFNMASSIEKMVTEGLINPTFDLATDYSELALDNFY